ncbi:hypothetical protein M378DRAFT_561048 [Amanita muscaria Koide BX008]|uniref:C2H2-type domain-containing protein n=1 Tax=Amanita muscaria (strain Koide BX008) TaxID=946122 RepID=A0A0C2SPA0_AMAMK|nr:hypothetical protein M378DRAFT_561048 [Amanita muscaria Koide BX008]
MNTVYHVLIAGQVPFNPPSGAAGSPTSYPMIDSSPQSQVWPSPSGHPCSPDISPRGLPQFGENEHSQPGNSQVPWRLLIPRSGVAGPPTSSTTTTASSAQSPVGSSAAVTTENDLKTVGSTQSRKASAKRRKKDAIHQCPYCISTFTEPHNLHYHINRHLGLKPYKCTICEFATVYPTTLGQHMVKRHQVVKVQVIPCEPESFR